MPDYGYFNARLRGMKTSLLTGGDYEAMLKSSGVRHLMEIVHRTGLKPDLDKALIRYQGIEALEEAFKADFIHACRKVLDITEGRQRRLVRILLRRWDVFNIKSLLRGKHAEMTPPEISGALVPAGELDDLALRELAGQPGVKEVVDLLATWDFSLADPLVENLDGYYHDHSLVRLESGLDKAYFEESLRATRGPGRNRRLVNTLLRSEIDIVNVMGKIRLILDDIDTYVETKEERTARKKKEMAEARRRKREERRKLKKPVPPRVWRTPATAGREIPPPPSIQTCFIQGGRELGGERLGDLLRTRSIGELLRLLSDTSLGRLISAEIMELEMIPDPGIFERSMEVDLVKRLTSVYRREPLGIAMAVSYLWMRYNQLVNLRIISRGKEFNIPENILRAEMVYAP